MSFRQALQTKCKKRWIYWILYPAFWAMFRAAAELYLKDSAEPERFREFWLS